MNNQLSPNFSIQSYIDKNREKLDESLVSLRLMREIDDFLDYKNLSNKDLASQLNFTESYISQLMSGIKKINVAFINKFEKTYNVKFDFKLHLNEEKRFLKYTNESKFIEIHININNHNIYNSMSSLTSRKFNNKSFFEYEDAEIFE